MCTYYLVGPHLLAEHTCKNLQGHTVNQFDLVYGLNVTDMRKGVRHCAAEYGTTTFRRSQRMNECMLYRYV